MGFIVSKPHLVPCVLHQWGENNGLESCPGGEHLAIINSFINSFIHLFMNALRQEAANFGNWACRSRCLLACREYLTMVDWRKRSPDCVRQGDPFSRPPPPQSKLDANPPVLNPSSGMLKLAARLRAASRHTPSPPFRLRRTSTGANRRPLSSLLGERSPDHEEGHANKSGHQQQSCDWTSRGHRLRADTTGTQLACAARMCGNRISTRGTDAVSGWMGGSRFISFGLRGTALPYYSVQ